MSRPLVPSFRRWLFLLFVGVLASPVAADKLELNARVAVVETTPNSQRLAKVERKLDWDPAKTAIVICDMWDKHWCRGATARVAEMAPRMNEVVQVARAQGVLIIHCPSSCMSYYKDTPMRRLAQQAPAVDTQIPLQTRCRLDADKESPLPIDDSDGGCDCWPVCQQDRPWKRQIDTIQIEPQDAITDSTEAFYLMRQRGIENVIVMGVHTNMCVLTRPFSIRQMVYQGQNVVLMRDLTDTMYNSRMEPFVTHVRGNELVVDHIERYWCPTITSSDFTGKPPFRFREADQAHVVFLIGEREYDTKVTLPRFAQQQLESRGLRCTILHADEQNRNRFAGIEALKTADLLVVSVRRRSPPSEQLQLIHEYLDAGKPLLGVRTASHAFHTRGQHPEGHAEWQDFDPDVLGGNYRGHHKTGPVTRLHLVSESSGHPILNGVSASSLSSRGSLYKVAPLAKLAQPLLIGAIPDEEPEPVAWTHTYQDARIFYTSLGHPDDFEQADFVRLLRNAVFWALDQPLPDQN